jgi:hypothetical protein
LSAVGDPGTTCVLTLVLRFLIWAADFSNTALGSPARPYLSNNLAWSACTFVLTSTRSSELLRTSAGPPANACKSAAMTAKLANAASTPTITVAALEGLAESALTTATLTIAARMHRIVLIAG